MEIAGCKITNFLSLPGAFEKKIGTMGRCPAVN